MSLGMRLGVRLDEMSVDHWSLCKFCLLIWAYEHVGIVYLN